MPSLLPKPEGLVKCAFSAGVIKKNVQKQKDPDENARKKGVSSYDSPIFIKWAETLLRHLLFIEYRAGR